jgi:CRISPR-associated exonuclease Cas4
MSLLALLLIAAILVYALLTGVSRRERAEVGLTNEVLEYTDDATEPAPTLRSDRYGLVGRPDQLARVGNALVPLEQKPRSRRLQQSHILQVAAQCLLVQEVYGVRPPYGVVVLASGSRRQGEFSPQLERRLLDTMSRMRAMLGADTPPEPVWISGKCRACGFSETCWGRDAG